MKSEESTTSAWLSPSRATRSVDVIDTATEHSKSGVSEFGSVISDERPEFSAGHQATKPSIVSVKSAFAASSFH